MHDHGIFHDSKAQSRATQSATTSFIHAIETLKDARQMFLWHARAIIGKAELTHTQ